MRILCLTDFLIPEGSRWLWDFIPGNTDKVNFITVQTRDKSEMWGKIIHYYPTLLTLGWKAIKQSQRDKYDLIFAWEGKNGFPLALLRKLMNVSEPPLFIHTFSIRGPIKYFLWLQKIGIQGVDHITVPTEFEKSYYAKSLNFPITQISCCPIGIYDYGENTTISRYGNFILSGGRSGRDYKTLFGSLCDSDIPLILNARPFNLRGLSKPPNVIINDILPINEFRKLNQNARFVVIPLEPVNEAVGLTSILFAMAAGKAVIASNVSGIREYVIDGVTGLLVPPNDHDQLKSAIQYLWNNLDACRNMGKQARRIFEDKYTFAAMANRSHNIMLNFFSEQTYTKNK